MASILKQPYNVSMVVHGPPVLTFGGPVVIVPAVPQISYVEGSQISQATGTAIGDMTSNGGLAAAFDSTDAQAAASCAAKTGSPSSAYIGKNYSAAPKRIFKAEVIGAASQGVIRDVDPSTTITLYGKNGSAPSLASPGTSLGSTNFTDSNAATSPTRTITNTGTLSQLWDYVIVVIAGSGGSEILAAEVKFYEAVAA